jgi:hypothetical protein
VTTTRRTFLAAAAAAAALPFVVDRVDAVLAQVEAPVPGTTDSPVQAESPVDAYPPAYGHVGDYYVDRNGHLWLCTASGHPGHWAPTGP